MFTMAKRSGLLLLPLLFALLALANFAAWARQGYYIDPSQVDLVHILAPPPSPSSVEGKPTCKRFWQHSTLEPKAR
jgi:hypothetical protein